MIVALRGLLAVILLAGAYLLVSVLVLFYVALCGLCVWAIADGTFNVTFIWLLFGGGLVVIALVRAIAEASGPTAVLPDSVVVHRERAPGLWDLVTELAERAGTRTPAEIHLTAEANAAVSEDARWLGLAAGERRMYIGMPLLVGLPTDELRAVLCHELGHYARGHTRLGPLIYRGSVALTDARRGIARAALANGLARMYAGLPYYLLSGYTWLYNGISLAVRRRQELDADATAARIAGRAATADALRSVESLSLAWADFRARFLEPMGRRGLVPDDPFSAFQTMIEDPDYRDVLAEHRNLPTTRPRATASDSHPSLEQRLARLDRLPDSGVPRDPSGSLGLLPDAEQLSHRVRRQAARRLIDPMPWRDWLSALTDLDADTQLADLRAAVHGIDPGTFSLGLVLDLLEAGQSDRLADALAGPDVPQAKEILTEAVFTLAGQALVRAGSASWTAPWTGTRRLVTRDTTPEELRDLVRAAVRKPTEVSRLRLDLAASAVDVALPVPPPAGGKPVSVALWNEHEELLDEQRSNLKVLLTLAIPTVAIAALIGFSSNGNDPPAYTPPRYLPARTTAPLPYLTYPPIPPLPTFQMPTLPPLPTLPPFTLKPPPPLR